jgi:hypothetical protein
LQIQATEKKENTNRFALSEEGDSVASVQLTFFQATPRSLATPFYRPTPALLAVRLTKFCRGS